MTESHPFFYRLCVLASVLLFSTGGLAIKATPLDPLVIAGMRSLIAAAMLGLYFIARQDWGALRIRGTAGAIAVAAYFLTVTGFVVATKWTTAANTIFLQSTMPIWVLIGGALWLKERITFDRLASVIICMLGMSLFFFEDVEPLQWKGNLVALGTGVAFAGVVLSFRYLREGGALAVVVWGNALTALLVTPIGLWFDPPSGVALLSGEGWGPLLWLGVFQVGLAYVCYTTALRGLPAIEVALISLVEPFLNPLWVYIGIGETPSIQALIGGGMIMVVVTFRTLLGNRNNKGA